jgi:N-glycosylase/DNA lyase
LKTTIAVPPRFDLLRTIYSHGWCSLQPFSVDKTKTALQYGFASTSGNISLLTLRQHRKGSVELTADTSRTPSASDKKEINAAVRQMLRLDEDLTEFYSYAKKHREYHWALKIGAGRLLRAPTMYEDLIKMMMTTNCSWGLTTVMVKNLCMCLGEQVGEDSWTFPTPQVMAEQTERFYRDKIRAGYRAPYLLEVAKRITKKELDVEHWRSSPMPPEELFEEFRDVKGVGPYVAGTLLRLIGHYDYLAIDSSTRKTFRENHGRKNATDKQIEKYYAEFGKWRGLFFWLDCTKSWYEERYPF